MKRTSDLPIIPLLLSLLIPLSVFAANLEPATTPFRFRLFQEPVSLDWTYKKAFYEIAVVMNVMEGLVEVDDQFEPHPALAEKWELSPDKLTYTFTLKPDCKWSDGVPLKASDFVYSMERLLSPESKSEFAYYFYDIKNAKAFNRGMIKNFKRVGFKALNNNQIQIQLKRSAPNFLQLFHHYVTFPLRRDLVTKSKRWWMPPKLVTLGPYTLSKWDRGKLIVFKKNKNYCGTPGSVDQVNIVLEKKDAKVKELAAENKLDVLFNASTSDIVKFTTQTQPPWTLKHFEALNTTFVSFNMKSKWGANEHLRRAIAQAMDLSRINEVMQSGLSPAGSLIPPKMAGAESVKLPINLAQAKKSLALADWPSTNAPKLELVFRDGMHNKIARYLADIIKQNIDIDLELTPVPPGDFVKIVKSGKYPLAIETYWADYPDPAKFVKLFVPESGFNRANWKNNEYTALIEKAEESKSMIEKMSYYQKAQKILIHDDAVVIPLYHSHSVALLNNRVIGFEVNPMTSHWFFKKIILKSN